MRSGAITLKAMLQALMCSMRSWALLQAVLSPRDLRIHHVVALDITICADFAGESNH